jgi:YHS domain-containing protein
MTRPTRHAVPALALAAAALLGGCAGDPAAPAGGPTAECPVCRAYGDLACLAVHVEPTTPRCTCGGETYYFCSDECRAKFQQNPTRFTHAAR